ncbi:MAG: NACHT domain-containing protein, partial [Spirulinaceae cyanobacterium RM2_2_10]|nr:NACHT domain-containing protein [Spirulinaceae cyanobacterium RM2_2_10]
TDLLIGFDQQRNFERFGLAPHRERLPGREAAERYPRLMVLGQPGAGKTVFLRSLAIACARGEFLPQSFPVLVNLPNLHFEATDFSLSQYLQFELGLGHSLQAERVLNAGKLLLVLDGIDELPEQPRRHIQQQIRDFVLKYSNNHFILSSHTQLTDYSFPTFEYVEVAALSDEQIADFSNVWFSASVPDPDQAERQTQEFLSRLRSPEASKIAAIAVTPTLLSFACFVYSELRILPLQLYDLYEYCLNFLLDIPPQADAETQAAVYNDLDLQRRYELMSHVAISTFERAEFFFTKRQLLRLIAEYLMHYGQAQGDREQLLQRSRLVRHAFTKHYKLLSERAPPALLLCSPESARVSGGAGYSRPLSARKSRRAFQ